jgi:hypothetical protein
MADGRPINRQLFTGEDVEADWNTTTNVTSPSATAQTKATDVPEPSRASSSSSGGSNWPAYYSPDARFSPAQGETQQMTFSRTAKDDDRTDIWLHAFNTYINFKKTEG